MKTILNDFWQFVKKPNDKQFTEANKMYKWKVFFTLFVFKVFFTIIYAVLNFLINKFFPLEHKLNDLNLSPIKLVLVVSFLVPFIEEVVFRLALRRKGIIKKIVSEETWFKYFSTFTYFSVVIFALIHGANYKFESYNLIFLVPFLTLSQFVSGFVITYLRVRFNFWMGYLMHAFWNFLAISIYTFSMFFGDITTIDTTTYHLEIKESSSFQLNEQTLMFSANLDTIYQLNTKGYKTKAILEAIHAEEKFEPVSEYININFTSKKGIPTDSLLHILEKEKILKKKAKTD